MLVKEENLFLIAVKEEESIAFASYDIDELIHCSFTNLVQAVFG